MHHLLYILPLLALALFILLPSSQALMLYLPILIVYSIFYWVVWKDKHRPVTLGIEGMIGGMAQVIEHEAGEMKVFYRGEIWDAICAEPVVKDAEVKITGLDHMKLIVKPYRKWLQN